MSSSSAGKFQDHYKVLDVDQNADVATVRHSYEKMMACRPSALQLEELSLALEVLTDPHSRKLFDAVRGGGDDERDLAFSGMDFFNSLQGERDRRATLLCVLYDVRRNNPRVPLITMRQLEKIVRMSEEEIQLALWYLKTLGWVIVDDKSKMQITAIGVDYLQTHVPDPSAVWPHLKMDAPDTAPAQAPESAMADPPPEAEPIPVPVPITVHDPIPEPSPSFKTKPISMLRRTQVSVG